MITYYLYFFFLFLFHEITREKEFNIKHICKRVEREAWSRWSRSGTCELRHITWLKIMLTAYKLLNSLVSFWLLLVCVCVYFFSCHSKFSLKNVKEKNIRFFLTSWSSINTKWIWFLIYKNRFEQLISEFRRKWNSTWVSICH